MHQQGRCGPRAHPHNCPSNLGPTRIPINTTSPNLHDGPTPPGTMPRPHKTNRRRDQLFPSTHQHPRLVPPPPGHNQLGTAGQRAQTAPTSQSERRRPGEQPTIPTTCHHPQRTKSEPPHNKKPSNSGRTNDPHHCECGEPLQTAHHILTSCPRYAAARSQYIIPLTSSVSLSHVFGTKEGGVALGAFLAASQGCIRPRRTERTPEEPELEDFG
jgi:hypothetical protein